MDIAFGMMEAPYSCCWRLLRGNGRRLIWLVLGHGGRLHRNAFTRDALALDTLIRFIVVSDVGIADDFNGITLVREFYPKAGPVPKGGQMKRVALFIIALIFAGLVYEQRGEWRHRKRYPQIGHSVDIGRRTLNIYCSSEGDRRCFLRVAPIPLATVGLQFNQKLRNLFGPVGMIARAMAEAIRPLRRARSRRL